METTQLKKIVLSTEMMNANQISSYIDEYQDEILDLNSTHSVQNRTIYKAILDKDYTAFEVFATSADIIAGEKDKKEDMMQKFNISESDASSMVWTDIEYKSNVLSSMKIDLIMTSTVEKDDTDIFIDWGDGNISDLKTERIVGYTAITDDDKDGIAKFETGGRNLIMTHKYEKPGKYIVRIYGLKYSLLEGAFDYSTKIDGTSYMISRRYNIISRIFEKDLPFASCIGNMSSGCKGSGKILRLNIPYGYQFKNLNNMSQMFAENNNLVEIYDGGGNFYRKDILLNGLFAGCRNLKKYDCDSGYIPTFLQMIQYDDRESVYCGCYNMFNNCKNLEVDVLKLIPNFFANKVLSMFNVFSNCEKLTCSDYKKLGELLWNNKTTRFITTSHDLIKDDGTKVAHTGPDMVKALPAIPTVPVIQAAATSIPSIADLTDADVGKCYLAASTDLSRGVVLNRFYQVQKIDGVFSYKKYDSVYGRRYQLTATDNTYSFSHHTILQLVMDGNTKKVVYTKYNTLSQTEKLGKAFDGCTSLDLDKVPFSWGGNMDDNLIEVAEFDSARIDAEIAEINSKIGQIDGVLGDILGS